MRRDFRIAIPGLVLDANKIAISLLWLFLQSGLSSKPVVPIKIGIPLSSLFL